MRRQPRWNISTRHQARSGSVCVCVCGQREGRRTVVEDHRGPGRAEDLPLAGAKAPDPPFPIAEIRPLLRIARGRCTQVGDRRSLPEPARLIRHEVYPTHSRLFERRGLPLSKTFSAPDPPRRAGGHPHRPASPTSPAGRRSARAGCCRPHLPPQPVAPPRRLSVRARRRRRCSRRGRRGWQRARPWSPPCRGTTRAGPRASPGCGPYGRSSCGERPV